MYLCRAPIISPRLLAALWSLLLDRDHRVHYEKLHFPLCKQKALSSIWTTSLKYRRQTSEKAAQFQMPIKPSTVSNAPDMSDPQTKRSYRDDVGSGDHRDFLLCNELTLKLAPGYPIRGIIAVHF